LQVDVFEQAEFQVAVAECPGALLGGAGGVAVCVVLK
jgi:hypothetical protein